MTFDPAATITSAAGDLLGNFQDIAVGVLPVAVGVLAITYGWRFAKRFLRG